MAISLKHAFTSNVSDSADATLVQPSNWNAEHTMSAAANTIIGAVTAGPVTEITCTAAGRDLLDDADAAAQRTTLGLVIGTNVQAWDADLDAIAAIAGTTGLLKKNAANTWSLDTSTYLTSVNLATNVSGTLPVTNGGTGATTSNGALLNLVGYQSIATAAGTTALTVSSPSFTIFTGTTTQTVQMPDTATLQVGHTIIIVNTSTGTVTPQTFGGTANFTTLTAGLTARYVCVSTSGNTTADWVNTFEGATTRNGTGALIYGTAPQISGLSVNASQNGLTAGTNAQGQGTIGSTSDVVVVTTTAANPSGVTLSASTQGRRVTIVNRGTNPINVYPPSGSQIDALGTNNSFRIPVNGMNEFNCVSSTLWYSDIGQQSSASAIGYSINGGGAVITTGIAGVGLTIPFACTITEWTLQADVSGSIVVDIWKDTYANYPPTVADTITGSAKPTISASNKGNSSTLTGWTTSIAAGDILYFNVDSCSTITNVVLTLKVTKT